MPNFSYKAAEKSGKETKGVVQASNAGEAALALKQKGLVVISVGEESALSKEISFDVFSKRPKPRDLSVFCRQFVSIVSAGVPMVAALDMLAEQTENKILARAIAKTKLSIEKGETLADAMREHTDVFPSLFITLVEAGEASGSLEVSFTRMAEQFEKEAHLKSLMKKATIYPAFVGIVAVAVVIFLLSFVIPKFQDMFEQLGTTLPGITLFVIGASKFVQNYWYLLLGGVILLILLIRTYAKSPSGQRFFGMLSMKAPLFGKLTVKSASSRMARTLSTLLGAGIPLIEALDITSNVMSNVYFKEALQETKDEVAMGSSVSAPLERGKLFPPLVYHMLKIGEETGNIEGMLSKLADYYEDEVEIATQSLMAALEPTIIILLAVIVGTLILAVILPMADLYSSLDAM